MLRPLTTLVVLALFLFSLAGCGDDGSTSPQINPNRVWVDTASCAPGEQVEMKVWIHNAEPVQVIEVPVIFSEACCTVSGVELSADVTPFVADFTWTDADPEPLRVDLIVTPVMALPDGDHLLATITVSIAADAQEQHIQVDTYSYISDIVTGHDAMHTLGFATPGGKTLTPSFTKGEIEVQAAPDGALAAHVASRSEPTTSR